MKNIRRTAGVVLTLCVVGLSSDRSQKPIVNSKATAQCEVSMERVAAIEKAIDRIMSRISGESAPKNLPTPKNVERFAGNNLDTARSVLIEKKLIAAEKTLSNLLIYFESKPKPDKRSLGPPEPGRHCHWVRDCSYLTCCDFNPPADGGPITCVPLCCSAYVGHLECN